MIHWWHCCQKLFQQQSFLVYGVLIYNISESGPFVWTKQVGGSRPPNLPKHKHRHDQNSMPVVHMHTCTKLQWSQSKQEVFFLPLMSSTLKMSDIGNLRSKIVVATQTVSHVHVNEQLNCRYPSLPESSVIDKVLFSGALHTGLICVPAELLSSKEVRAFIIIWVNSAILIITHLLNWQIVG